MDSGIYELIIIGAGPAGMTAAVYARRKGLRTLVISKDIGGQVNWAANVENYMGFKEIGGVELMRRFEEQMKDPELQYLEKTVVNVQTGQGVFTIQTEPDEKYRARTVILATGKRPRMLRVPGETEFRGRGVSYCSTCDAPFFKNLPVAVVGGGNSAVQAVLDLSGWAGQIHLLLIKPLTADKILIEKLTRVACPVFRHEKVKVKEIFGDKRVTGVRLEILDDGTVWNLEVRGVFIEIGLEPNSEIVNGLVQLNNFREAVVDCRCQTNIEGLFAAGDVTNVHEKQIMIACGEGAKAALSAAEYLVFKKRLPECE